MHFAYNMHMAKTLVNIQFRMDGQDKKKLAQILDDAGLDIPTAFRMFAKSIIKRRGIDFYVGEPQRFSKKGERELLKALKEAEDPKNLVGPFYDAKSLIASLNS